MTGVVSLTLVNVYEITDEKKNGISKLYKKCCAYAITLLKVQVMAVFNPLLDCENARKQVIYVKSHHLKTFSCVTVSLSLKN